MARSMFAATTSLFVNDERENEVHAAARGETKVAEEFANIATAEQVMREPGSRRRVRTVRQLQAER